ncbi:MAG: hypothetical protein HPY81_04450 [Firmicutes bacterium]|nr:hypothetical protein [Bacillota bacterium]
MRTILFVCTGNTCRSSMAEALAREIWVKKGGSPEELRIISAGTAAIPAAPASREAIAVMKEEGIDLGSHRAQQLTPAMIHEADLILTMSASHRRQVLEMVPSARDKVFLLKEFACGQEELPHLEQQMAELQERIRQKEERFYTTHRQEIEQLRQERTRLMAELHRVEDRLNEWQVRYQEELADEIREMRQLESQMRALDIPDPFGQPLPAYQECARELRAAIERALDRLRC